VDNERLCVMVLMETKADDVKAVAVKMFEEVGVFVGINNLFIDNSNTVNPYDWTVCTDYYARKI